MIEIVSGPGWCGVSRPVTIPGRGVNCEEPGIPSRVRVLTVGIDAYQNKEFVQRFAAADAAAVAEAFRKMGADATTLLDKDATRAGIEQAVLAAAAKSKSCDAFVFVFVGVGNALPGDGFYLLPVDVTDAQDARVHGISSNLLWAWLDKIQAENILIILDTGDANDFFNVSIPRMSDRTRLVSGNLELIAPQGHSYEDKALGHGVLTYGILQAIKPESDLNADGYLSVAELEAATYVNVLRAQKNRPGGLALRARSFSSGKDFALGRIGTVKAAKVAGDTASEPAAAPKSDRQATAPGPVLKGKYLALVVATNKYDTWEELHNPVFDADAVEKELKDRYGFKVISLRNPTKDEFGDKLAELRTRPYGPDDELLIFITGHGTYDEDLGTGYLVMKNSKRQQEDRNYSTYFSHDDLFKLAKVIKCQHVFLVIDACKSGAIADMKMKADDPKKDITYPPAGKLEGLQRKKDLRSFIFLTAGGNEYVPDGNPGAHSPFAFYFLRALRSNDPEGIVTFLDIIGYANQVPTQYPQPVYGWFYNGGAQPGSDFWLVSRPELRGEPTGGPQ